MSESSYLAGVGIVGVPAFLIAWIYCMASYGFLGFALGWIPAGFAALIIGALWPLWVVLAGFGIIIAVIISR